MNGLPSCLLEPRAVLTSSPVFALQTPRQFHCIIPNTFVIFSPMESGPSYLPRVVDAELRLRLQSVGAVVVEGPKACGKTATARRAAGSEVLLDVDDAMRGAARVAPELVLAGPVPRLIDEWQVEPTLWNHVRRAVDDRGKPGQFILTGSSVPADDITRHTGAGRLSRMRMRPLSLFESGHSTGAVSLNALLQGEMASVPDSGHGLQDIAERIVVGGWPLSLRMPVQAATRAAREYLDEARRVDLPRLDGGRRDPDRVGRVLASLARNVATTVSAAVLATDTGGAEGPIKDDTVREYLTALERLMILEDQPAWAPHLRSRSILRTSPKRHFVDPSLAVAALRGTSDGLLRDLRWMGFLFESLVVRDLRVYAQANDGVVRHYRDNTGLEVDIIVETGDGHWAAFEVKLGHSQVDAAAEQLKKFAERVDTGVCGEPAMLGVIVATGPGYRRPDGVAVVPVGALGP